MRGWGCPKRGAKYPTEEEETEEGRGKGRESE